MLLTKYCPVVRSRPTVDCPEHLSHGLVLVMWWPSAVPHYIIVGIFTGAYPRLLYDLILGLN